MTFSGNVYNGARHKCFDFAGDPDNGPFHLMLFFIVDKVLVYT